jgi:hypothetical protein
MSFQDDLMKAEAIREVRATGCTLPGVAELIVEHHGAIHILANTTRIQALGEEVAASDTETGAKMRQLLQESAKAMETAASDVLEKIVGDEKTSSKPAETQADAGASAPAPSLVPAAAAAADTSGDATAAAGNSAAPSESTA